jgi:hypothetical protein
MSDSKSLSWKDDALAYILAGRATLTIESIADGSRETYRINQKIVYEKDEHGNETNKVKARLDFWFVNLRAGKKAGGEWNYKYLGVVDEKHGARAFRTTGGTKKNKKASADNINLVGDVIGWLVAGKDHSHQFRLWHSGRCGRCAQPLTVPSSIATGLGPVCAKNMGVAMKKVTPSAVEKLAALDDGEPQDSGAFLR